MIADFHTARRTPKERRAPESQAHISSPNAASGNSADHLVPIDRPQNTPVASRHGRQSSRGPHDLGSSRESGAIACASLARREARRGFKNFFMPSNDNDAPFV